MQQVGSKIERVVVYHEGARVRRTVELSWTNKAPFAVEIVDLPLSLEDATVRVRVERVTTADGDSEPAVIDASHVRVGLYVPPAPEVGAVPDRSVLLKALLAIEHNEDAQDQIKTEIALLQNIPVPARPEGEEGKPAPASPMSSRLALEQILDASTASRTKELRVLEDQRRELEREAETLKRTLESASTAREFKPHELRKAVVVELLVRKGNATSVTLSLEYHVSGARWAPAYQCRMDREGRRAEIVMRAHICQLTGEDWSGVALTLSTASPMSWTELPEPTAIKIGKAQAAPPRPAPRPPPVGALSLFQDFDRERSTVADLLPNFPVFGAQPFELTSPPSLHKHVARRAQRASWQGSLEAAPKAEAAYVDTPFAEITDEDIDTLFNDGAEPSRSMAREMSLDDAPSPSPAPPPAPPAPYASAPAPIVDAMMASKKRARPRDGSSEDDESTLSILLYAQLKLAAATSTEERTRLTTIGMRESYAESLDRRGRVVRFEDAARKIAAVKAGEARVLEMSLPTGACDVRASARHFDYAYSTDVNVDVPSDGMFHSIPVGVRQADADMRYVVVPREDTGVFRQANITNPLNSPLLQGPVEIYVGGDYVLTTTLYSVPTGGEFQLGLGVEQSIKCARNTKYREERSGNKVVATNELWHSISIELVNNLSHSISIEVRERLPVPQKDAEVVVEEGAVSPPWEVWDQTQFNRPIEGGRRWNLSIDAGATQRLEAEYVVKIYANNELAGGNRREA